MSIYHGRQRVYRVTFIWKIVALNAFIKEKPPYKQGGFSLFIRR